MPCNDGRWGVLRGAQQFLIGLHLPMEDSLLQQAKTALNRHGGWLSSYLDGTLLCIGPHGAAEAVRQIPGTDWLVNAANSEPVLTLTGILLHWNVRQSAAWLPGA